MPPIIFLPTHGPHLQRHGSAVKFDWREQCRIAVALQMANPGSVVYVPSAFQQTGKDSELEFYSRELRSLGLAAEALKLESDGLDTLEQCELALALAKRLEAPLMVISCGLHSLRLRYLLRGQGVIHVVAHGVTNPKLAFSHAVLAVVFPVIQACGLQSAWKRFVDRRRSQGKQ